eukprot:358487-Chlamydomonas_euryale.AAC.8
MMMTWQQRAGCGRDSAVAKQGAGCSMNVSRMDDDSHCDGVLGSARELSAGGLLWPNDSGATLSCGSGDVAQACACSQWAPGCVFMVRETVRGGDELLARLVTAPSERQVMGTAPQHALNLHTIYTDPAAELYKNTSLNAWTGTGHTTSAPQLLQQQQQLYKRLATEWLCSVLPTACRKRFHSMSATKFELKPGQFINATPCPAHSLDSRIATLRERGHASCARAPR